MDNVLFISDTYGHLRLEQVVIEIGNYMADMPSCRYKIMVGSDSKGRDLAEIVSVITVQRISNGGIFFRRISQPERYFNVRERIWNEAMQSITLAQELRARLADTLDDEFLWEGNEIHVDIGEKGTTKDFVEGITGMIRGFQFVPVIKPFSFCATTIADRYT